MSCLNRTFVELKLEITREGFAMLLSLNRTFVELKHPTDEDIQQAMPS